MKSKIDAGSSKLRSVFKPQILEYKLNTKQVSVMFYLNMDTREINPRYLGNIVNKQEGHLWSLDEYFDVDDKYLIFYSHHIKWTESRDSNNCLKAHVTNIELSKTLKIPLIDGVRMETPLGSVSVTRTKTIPDYESVNHWTNEDYKTFTA